MQWTQDRVIRVLFWGGFSLVLAEILSFIGLASCCCLSFLSLWGLTAGAYLFRASMQVSPTGKAVVITGCDTGFGNALAIRLHQLGFRVFALCLRLEGAGIQKLREEHSKRLHVIQADVTKQDQLDRALQEVKSQLPVGEVLWGLVNNAGVCTIGPVEWLSNEQFRKDPEVNLFGVIAATKTFLPLVRRARGRIVNVASVAGRVCAPLMAAYNASKYAVEGFNDALRLEMHPWGVKVCLIEPGNFGSGTELFTREEAIKEEVDSMWLSLDEEIKSDYGEVGRKRVETFMRNIRNKGASDISPVITAFTEALTQQYPQTRYDPMDPLMYFTLFLGTHFPGWVFDFYFALMVRLSKK
ncbi:D-beta-hydroxybutyrate dehydrogenase, mitochondrial-like [Penaeus monodon]|uniref:D-beta-hydroxybutyrate dehydrogenase, mitochondrial-like n=1 Tax=Penaeus monodon TaxID=6687 RepID=UPI0018A71BA9|nr:D-beta-hydroxybutyrate dehydrogenase, mitochondrial-like [Penaeus monodon]XP_037783265.1 D-beta-hydroxybutyrate dehydrogenase, mitochondrial-like [Penaeus monodon]